MTYNKILKQLAVKENVSVKEVENEMNAAIKAAGLNCSAKEFIGTISTALKKKTIYSNIV